MAIRGSLAGDRWFAAPTDWDQSQAGGPLGGFFLIGGGIGSGILGFFRLPGSRRGQGDSREGLSGGPDSDRGCAGSNLARLVWNLAEPRHDRSSFGTARSVGGISKNERAGACDQSLRRSFLRVPTPGVISSRILEAYNKSFAPTRNLPQLSGALVVGFSFPVEFNSSMVAPSVRGSPIPSQVQVVGVSDRALLAGITIPLSTAIRLNQGAGVDSQTFTGATLVAKSAELVPTIAAQARRMGLKIDDQERRMAENVGFAVTLTTSALALLSILICALAAANIAQTLFASVRARAKEIGIMQSVGASRSDVRNIILGEAAAIGMVGGALGTIGALVAEHAVDRLSLSYLPSFPFKPESFFSHPWTILLGGVSLGIVAAVLGAYAPSRRAAATDPAQTLSE